jgi:hypothetical protein
MIQRCLPKRTRSPSFVFTGNVESQYLIGFPASPLNRLDAARCGSSLDVPVVLASQRNAKRKLFVVPCRYREFEGILICGFIPVQKTFPRLQRFWQICPALFRGKTLRD